MAGGIKTTKVVVIVVAAIMSSLALPAYSQSFKKGVTPSPSGESKPKVDEKAYNAALDRIPAPKQPYDPWGVARPSEPAKPGKSSPPSEVWKVTSGDRGDSILGHRLRCGKIQIRLDKQ